MAHDDDDADDAEGGATVTIHFPLAIRSDKQIVLFPVKRSAGVVLFALGDVCSTGP